jgi:uridine phosphorylase
VSFLPNLAVASEAIAERAIVVGDPARVEGVAAHLDAYDVVGHNREYRTITGTTDGVRVTVASHGVGAAGASICFEELFRGGAKAIVRLGTCGGIAPSVDSGSVVVATAAVRADGVTDCLAPVGFPAVCDPMIAAALTAAADAAGLSPVSGIVHTGATLYPSPVVPLQWDTALKLGEVAVEMELSALLILASLHGARAGGIFVADGNVLASASDMSDYDPHSTVVADAKARLLPVVVGAVARLAI